MKARITTAAKKGVEDVSPLLTSESFAATIGADSYSPHVMAENIYQMYVANGNKADFWVQRNSWSWQTALITSIGGQAEGDLEGLPPYFKNQKVKGRMGGAGREIDISCPGTYGYRRVDLPSP